MTEKETGTCSTCFTALEAFSSAAGVRGSNPGSCMLYSVCLVTHLPISDLINLNLYICDFSYLVLLMICISIDIIDLRQVI